MMVSFTLMRPYDRFNLVIQSKIALFIEQQLEEYVFCSFPCRQWLILMRTWCETAICIYIYHNVYS